MDYEKRYNEIIEAIKQLRDINPSDEGLKNWVNDNIPELMESEDKKIMEEIIQYLEKNKEGICIYKDKSVLDSWISWIEQQGNIIKGLDRAHERIDELIQKNNTLLLQLVEKQGEQKPQGKTALEAIKEEKVDNVNKIEPKFKVEEGKWYVCTQTFVLRGKIVVIKGQIYQAEKDNAIKGEDGSIFIDRHDGKASDYFRLWTIRDAKDGDVLVTNFEEDNIIVMYRSMCTINTINVHCCLDNKFTCGNNIGVFDSEGVHPSTKEQRNLLFQKMKEAGYEWDADKKELKKNKSCDVVEWKKGDIVSDGNNVVIVDGMVTYEGKPVIESWYFADSEKFYGLGTSETDLWNADNFRLASPTERAHLFLKMKEAGYEWDDKNNDILVLDSILPEPSEPFELIHEFVEKFGRVPKDEDELNALVEYVLKRVKNTELDDADLKNK